MSFNEICRFMLHGVKIEPLIYYDGAGGEWRKSFAVLPHRTIKKKLVWMRPIYQRKVWLDYGLGIGGMEPRIQYAELFDILQDIQ